MTDALRPSARDALIEAAFVVFARDSSAPLAAVAEKAGVGRATLHRHFAGRADLVRALARQAVTEMDAAVEAATADAPSWSAALRGTLTALVPLGDRYGFLNREPIDDLPEIAAEYRRWNAETRAAVEAAQREGVFDPTIPPAWIADAFDHLLDAAWEAVRARRLTHAQAADLAWRTLTAGLGVPADDA